MKALSIRQPWAWLIVNGHKDVENRTWPTKYRGQVLIHAGKAEDKTFRPDGLPDICLDISPDSDLEYGGIIGMAEIVDCVHTSNSPWYTGPYGFVLKNAKPLPFFPCKGQLGFFNLELLL